MKIKIGSVLNNFKKLYANGGQLPGDDNLDLSAHPNFYNQASKPWTVDDSKKMIDNNPALYDTQRHYKQGITEPPIQADYTPEMIAAAVAMPAAQGFGKVGNFIADAVTGTMRSPGQQSWIHDLKDATAAYNPSNLDSKSGLEWMKDWYESGDTRGRMFNHMNGDGLGNSRATNNFYAHLKQDAALKNLDEYKQKNYIDLLKDKGIKEFIEKSITSNGVSYGNPDNIYVRDFAYHPFNNKGYNSTQTHELTHLIENNGLAFNDGEKDALLKPFGHTNQSIFGTDRTPREVLGSKSATYYHTPTEIHARMNEARFGLGLKPGEKFTPEMYDKVLKEKDWYGMGKYIKNKNHFVDLMNNFWATPAAVIGGAAASTDNKQKFPNGGNFVPYGNPNDPYQMSSPNNTFPGSTNSFPSNSRSAVGNNSITPPKMAQGTMDTSGVGTKPSSPNGADIAGYASMANTALSMIPTTQNDDYMMGNDATVSGIKDGVKQVPVAGQFVALGDTSSDMLYQQASKTSGLESQAWAGAAGTVSPSSGWEKKNEMYKSGEIDSTEFGISTLAHFVMPGLDTMYLQGKHNDYVDAGKKVESNLKDNQQFYQNNIGAYDAQMSSSNGKQFGKGGSNPNVWTLMDDSNPLAYGGQMTTEYKTGGTHEQNPNGGIPIGNSLVEEGEIRFDYLENKQPKSYIFSNRLKYKKNGK